MRRLGAPSTLHGPGRRNESEANRSQGEALREWPFENAENEKATASISCLSTDLKILRDDLFGERPSQPGEIYQFAKTCGISCLDHRADLIHAIEWPDGIARQQDNECHVTAKNDLIINVPHNVPRNLTHRMALVNQEIAIDALDRSACGWSTLLFDSSTCH